MGKPEEMIQWFCAVFNLGEEGENSIEAQILKQFTQTSRSDKGLSSSEIKVKPPIARSTIIYHLNRFIEAGILIKKGRKYHLRAPEMSKLMEEIEYDLEKEMQRMIDTAREFDKIMQKRFEEL